MTFLIRPPHRVKKRRSASAQATLDLLQSFLDDESEEPEQILYTLWKDQQKAVTYRELRMAVQDGALNQQMFEDWQQDYATVVTQKLANIWQQAIQAGAAAQMTLTGTSFSINMQLPGVVDWISSRGAEFVTSCTQAQKSAIQSLLAYKTVTQHTVDELARFIRPCIGLTEGQTKATLKLYDQVYANLKSQHPRMKSETARKKALDSAQKYAERQHRQRAMTIAQTELEYAYNQGADEAIRQAQAEGLLGKMLKRWCTSGDDNVCDICAALDGTEIGMDDSFGFSSGRSLFAGQQLIPPAHPRCACAVEYIEADDF